MADAIRFDDSKPEQTFADGVWYYVTPFQLIAFGILIGTATSVALEWREANAEVVKRTIATFTANDGFNFEGPGHLRKVDTGGDSTVVGVGVTRGTE